jgi:predicted DNA-binding transcriptional regulator AlpA
MNRAESDDDLLLMREVAELVRLPTATLRWMRHQGRGPRGFLVGRHVMYRRSAVRQWIREQEQAGSR